MTDLSDSSMLIIIHMYRKRRVTYYEMFSRFFLQYWRSKGGFTFNEQNLNSTSVHPEYIQWQNVAMSGTRLVYNHNNEDYVITEKYTGKGKITFYELC